VLEAALLRALVDRGGPVAAACLRWLVFDESASLAANRVDVRVRRPGEPDPF
jgi:hypothetical protein